MSIRKGSLGPEFQFSNGTIKNVIGDEWDSNIDQLWTKVHVFLDKKRLVSQEGLDYLDNDPFVLFGIDDPVTQKALYKLQSTDVLNCEGKTPTLEEWFEYLQASPIEDADIKWVVEAFSEIELPPPWSSYKGIGSIVCFHNKDSGVLTWKHPHYDYFFKLMEYCRKAPDDDVRKLRVHRLLWSYQLTLQPGASEPLLSPKNVENLADIFEVDLAGQPYLVRCLKAALKEFAHQFRIQHTSTLKTWRS